MAAKIFEEVNSGLKFVRDLALTPSLTLLILHHPIKPVQLTANN
jgi:hypothetical protein